MFYPLMKCHECLINPSINSGMYILNLIIKGVLVKAYIQLILIQGELEEVAGNRIEIYIEEPGLDIIYPLFVVWM